MKPQSEQIALHIKNALSGACDKRITHSNLATSYALHVAIEAVAESLDESKVEFKRACGVGQPLAYFI